MSKCNFIEKHNPERLDRSYILCHILPLRDVVFNKKNLNSNTASSSLDTRLIFSLIFKGYDFRSLIFISLVKKIVCPKNDILIVKSILYGIGSQIVGRCLLQRALNFEVVIPAENTPHPEKLTEIRSSQNDF